MYIKISSNDVPSKVDIYRGLKNLKHSQHVRLFVSELFLKQILADLKSFLNLDFHNQIYTLEQRLSYILDFI